MTMNETQPVIETALPAWATAGALLRGGLSRGSVRHLGWIALAFPSFILAYFVSLATYRIFFHPLSKYPGPVLAKLTSLVWTYHFTKGDIIRWNDELHTKYGETVRSGPNRLSFIGPRAWKDIYGHKHGQYKPNVKNLERFVGKLTSNVHPMATEPTMAGHAAQKRQFNHAFSDRALTEQESLIGKYIDQLIQLVRKEVAKSPNNKPEVDVAKLYNFTTFDVMGDLTFGEGLGQLETGVESSWVQAVFVTFKFMSKPKEEKNTTRAVVQMTNLGYTRSCQVCHEGIPPGWFLILCFRSQRRYGGLRETYPKLKCSRRQAAGKGQQRATRHLWLHPQAAR